MLNVSVHVSHVLNFVSQNIGMFHLSALAFIMSVFLTNMTDRDPVFYALHFLIVLLANDQNNYIYITNDTSESYSVGNVFDLGQKYI